MYIYLSIGITAEHARKAVDVYYTFEEYSCSAEDIFPDRISLQLSALAPPFQLKSVPAPTEISHLGSVHK